MSSPRPRPPAWALLGALTALCQGLGLWVLSDEGMGLLGWSRPRALQLQLALWLAAGLGWLGVLAALARERQSPSSEAVRRPGRGAVTYICLLGLLMRLPVLWLSLPAVHSGDVNRYFWDGAVQRAGLDPYGGSPEAGAYATVQAAHPALFASINHRHLPTIYPPAAQALFALHGRLTAGDDAAAALGTWRLLAGAAELVLWALLAGLIELSGLTDRRWLAVWVLSPMPAVEIWMNGHVDVFGLLLFAAALRVWPLLVRAPSAASGRLRAAAAGALLGLALLVKPLAAAVVPGLVAVPVRRRLLLALAGGAIVAMAAAYLPYREARLGVSPSLGEYGRRWRSNDGLHAVVHAGVERIVEATCKPPTYVPWEPWRSPRLARFVTGRDRDTVWPDELSNFLSRAIVGALFVGLLFVGLLRRLPPVPLGLLLLGGYALLTPTLHPWYLLWPLLLAALWREGAPPILLLVALSPLAYLPLPDELRGAPHHEAVWWRLVEHGAAWAAATWLVAARYRRGSSASPRRAIA